MQVEVPWNRNYYHLLTESLMGLVLEIEKRGVNDCEIWYNSPFLTDVVQFFSSKPIHREPSPAECVRYQTKYISEPEQLRVLLKMRTFVENKVKPIQTTPQVTIIKRLTHRMLTNFDELVAGVTDVSPLPVRVAVLEKMSFPDQVRLFQNTKLVVGAHGAGLTNMIFMPKGGGIIEVFPMSFYYPLYQNLTDVFGHAYYHSEATKVGTFDPKFKKTLSPYPCPRRMYWEYFGGNWRILKAVRDQTCITAPIDRMVWQVKDFFKHGYFCTPR